MRRSIALVTLAVLCGCAADSRPQLATASAAPMVTASAVLPSEGAPTGTPVVGDPSDVAYVDRGDSPFTVIESAEADALFETPDSCVNPVARYRVTYPDGWFTNAAVGTWPQCSWFSPSPDNLVLGPNGRPPFTAVVLEFGDMSFGHTDIPEYSVAEDVTVGGLGASRAEMVGHTGPNGQYFPMPPMYWYIVTIVERPGDEPTLYARTDFEGAADYELNKAVLDRIMALIVFDE